MKITRVETVLLRMPMTFDDDAVPKAGGLPRTASDMLLLQVDTDEGVTGWGEGFGNRAIPATRAVLDTIVGPACIGRDPTQIAALVGALEYELRSAGRNGPAMYALSALDIALWDIAGKLAGLPLYRLLGGSPRGDLPAYASLLRYGEPRAVARYVERALRRGHRQIKLHEVTADAIAAGRKAAGPDIPIMIDCNCHWTLAEAMHMARVLEPLDPAWLEEPVWPLEDHAGMARLRASTRIPIAAGENAMLHDFKRMFEAGALGVAQPSVAKIGGVTVMRKLLALAETFAVDVVPHSAYFGPGLIATIHCAAAMPRETLVERYDCEMPLTPMGDAIRPNAQGRLAVPQGPGLGVDPDPGAIERLRVG